MNFFSLVTLCNTQVILLQDSSPNHTWIFLGETEKWRKVAIVGDTPFLGKVVRIQLAMRDVQPSCVCPESVLVFPCGETNTSPIYKLSCVTELEEYSWTEISAHFDGTPSVFKCRSFATSNSKEMVFAISGNCLWQYSVHNSTWTRTESCIPAFTDWGRLTTALVSDLHRYFYFTFSGRMVIQLTANGLPGSCKRILGNAPDIYAIYDMRMVGGKQFLAHVTEISDTCGSSQWILRNDESTGVWVWMKLSSTVRFPSLALRSILSFRNDHVYLVRYALTRTVRSTTRAHVWSLDLETLRWEKVWQLNDSALNNGLRSESVWLDRHLWLMVSRSTTRLIQSMKQMFTIAHPMSPRSYFSLVAVNSTAALFFGGLTNIKIMSDLWLFSLMHNEWVELVSNSNPTLVPTPRYDHAAAVIESEMYIYGGRSNEVLCYEELWKFSVVEKSWDLVTASNQGPRLVPMEPCIAHAAAQAGSLWIAIGCHSKVTEYCRDSGYQLWTFVVNLKLWVRLTVYQTISTPIRMNMAFWRGYLLRLDTVQMTLFYTKLGCPKGLSSRNISLVACDVCQVGFFADTGSEQCVPCPRATTTTKQSSTTINDCSVCIQGYCQNGRCLVLTNNSQPVPFCQCNVGFTGSRCQYATYYYISLGVLLFVAAIALAITVIWYIRRKKKLRERSLCQQIEQQDKVWQIRWDELTMLEGIGSGASGRVRLALYRDITVAVKILMDIGDAKGFEEEIKLMQTMRHPNIVLFLGAGKSSSQGQPFLVVEFTSRGSLRHVLDDDSIELNAILKISFALDACKGMSFLHNLNPPRIHRDLKSDNLLVSKSWIVKVADFGVGRPLDSKSRNGKVRGRKRPAFHGKTITEPLLETGEDLSLEGIGTAKWSAPELLQGKKYDASIDVYMQVCTSMGCIVL